MPKLGMAEIRKPQLIEATLCAIETVGLTKANVQVISQLAGVTPAIINHYFGSKDDLLKATMRSILVKLGQEVREQLPSYHPDDVIGRIKAIVGGNFSPSQTNAAVTKTWLAFWAQSMHQPALARLQRVNERRLLSNLRFELNKILPPHQAALVAQGIAALIDGIWLRGALSEGGINVEPAKALIDDYLRLQLPAELFVLHHHYQTLSAPVQDDLPC